MLVYVCLCLWWGGDVISGIGCHEWPCVSLLIFWNTGFSTDSTSECYFFDIVIIHQRKEGRFANSHDPVMSQWSNCRLLYVPWNAPIQNLMRTNWKPDALMLHAPLGWYTQWTSGFNSLATIKSQPWFWMIQCDSPYRVILPAHGKMVKCKDWETTWFVWKWSTPFHPRVHIFLTKIV